MANHLIDVADNEHGATGNLLTIEQAKAIAAAAAAKVKLRWDPDLPLATGYDPVPVYYHALHGNTATFSLVSATTGEPILDERFDIDLDDRTLCHAAPPSTPRKIHDDQARIGILMLGPEYHLSAASAKGTSLAAVAKTASIDLTATGKWPRSSAGSLLDDIVAHAESGNVVDLAYLRGLFRHHLATTPTARVPSKLGL